MKRFTTLLALCCFLPAAAFGQQGAAAAGFNAATAASVWGAALAYIAPRSLQQVAFPQMAIWGLQGLTALDPNFTATLQNGQIRLLGPASVLISLPAPADDDPQGWARAAALVATAAYAASPALQQAGTQGLIESFFDELFNHYDPYSRYEPPDQAAQDQLMITGIAGSGLTLSRQGNSVVIGQVMADSPAAAAGLTAGLQVIAVNGQTAYPGRLDDLNNQLKGLLGTRITLRLREPEDPQGAAEDVSLTLGYVPPQTVFTEPFGGNVLALRITSFDTGTSDQVSAAISAGLADAPSAVVLDLRGNRGGVLRQAVLVADTLLPDGLIAVAAGRDADADQVFRVEGGDILAGLPIVVLVDGQTASAAEILAAALADNRRAVVVGSETLGKGLVQTVTALPDGGELFVTWSRVLAPRGWPVQKLGVMPQVCTSLGAQVLDQQIAALRQGRNLLLGTLLASRAARAPLPITAVLNIRNVCPAAIGGALDLTAAAALLAAPAAYQAALLPGTNTALQPGGP